MSTETETRTKAEITAEEEQLERSAPKLVEASRSRIRDMLKDEKKSKAETKSISWGHLEGVLKRTHPKAGNLGKVLERAQEQLNRMIDEIDKEAPRKR